MTSRERILRVLRGEQADRVPWTPCVDGYYVSTPGAGANPVDAIRAFGGDVMARHVRTYREKTLVSPAGALPGFSPWARETYSRGGIEVVTERKDGTLIQTTRTPLGVLKSTWVNNEHATWIPFPVEHQVKTVEDLKVLRYLYEQLEYEATYDEFLKEDRHIGDDGLATTTTPGTPFHDLLEGDIGIELCYYLLEDHPKEMGDLMAAMHESRKKACAIVAASPATVVIGYENTSTRTMSPAMYELYIEPQINDYADILHTRGKVFLTHMCGKLAGLRRQLARTRMDGIVDIAPEPTGDVSLGEARRMWGPDKVVMGGIDATAFQRMGADEMETHVRGILKDIGAGERVFLGSGDATPRGTPLDTLRAVTRTVARFGRYPLEA